MTSAEFIAGVNTMLARQIREILEKENAMSIGWQCHYDKARLVWVITLDGHEITTAPTKAEAVKICRKENGEESKCRPASA